MGKGWSLAVGAKRLGVLWSSSRNDFLETQPKCVIRLLLTLLNIKPYNIYY